MARLQFLVFVFVLIFGIAVGSSHSRSKRSVAIVYNVYTVDHFIELVEKIEQHPITERKSVKEIANYIRNLGYDSNKWTYLVGLGTTFLSLPNEVIDSVERHVLTNMIAHRYEGTRELGVVHTDSDDVAMGHVITGICAGLNRDKSLRLAQLRGLTLQTIDNLFAATISGDLGQTALTNKKTPAKPIFGPNGTWSPNTACPSVYNKPAVVESEATNAEILGDIDGFLLGSMVSEWVDKGVRLGQLLRMYYSGGVVYDNTYVSCKRLEKFKKLVTQQALRDQVEGFAYAFKTVWYGSSDFSSVPNSDVPEISRSVTEKFFPYFEQLSTGIRCPQQQKEDCELPANIVFVMDESGSIGYSNYQNEKEFVMNIIDVFEISPFQTRVAVIEYASSSYLSIRLQDYGSKTRLKCAVNSLSYSGGGTYTGKAIDQARLVMQSAQSLTGTFQSKVPQILILLTDGHSSNRAAFEASAENIKRTIKDLTIIVVGIGGYNLVELELVATDADKHVFTARNFGQLVNLVKSLRTETCETPAQLTIDFSVNAGPNETVVTGYVSPGKSRFFSLAAENFYTVENMYIEVTPYFGEVTVYASRTHVNPGPGNYTYKLEPKGTSRSRRSTDSTGAGEPLTLHVSAACQGYNKTTCPALYMAIKGTQSKLSCSERECTLPNQIKFRIKKENPWQDRETGRSSPRHHTMKTQAAWTSEQCSHGIYRHTSNAKRVQDSILVMILSLFGFLFM